ncbi:epoxide hydrolase [Kribbella sp. NBC_01505]|uniref:epoxide hydrolase family protein n=1 Tax=Kribbella sp. NBC_01505 TaxID=2903580 RepID=UPI003865E581
MPKATMNLEPTPIHVPEDVLDDLRHRLRATKWLLDAGNDDGFYGVRRTDLQALAEYWADGYDWRAAERAINAYDNYRVDVSGVPVHFLYKPGVGPAPIPLILSHGWPWTFWHWSKVIDQLADPAAYGGDPADAFDVIVPSLPGFGFSTPTSPDMNFWKIADVWHELMTGVLGHTRYAAGGCDVGALVTGQLGHKYADELYGIHIGSGLKLSFFNGDRAWDLTGGNPLPDNLPPAIHDGVIAFERRFAAHLAAHVLHPSTLGFGLADSPAGMLAWILERWQSWSDGAPFTPDDILTHATIYWAGNAIDTSIRTYANNNRYPWTPSHDRHPAVEAPTGITFVGYENPPGITTPEARVNHFLTSDRAPWYNHTNLTAHPTGGHFIPWELPTQWTTDLRTTFRPLR